MQSVQHQFLMACHVYVRDLTVHAWAVDCSAASSLLLVLFPSLRPEAPHTDMYAEFPSLPDLLSD